MYEAKTSADVILPPERTRELQTAILQIRNVLGAHESATTDLKALTISLNASTVALLLDTTATLVEEYLCLVKNYNALTMWMLDNGFSVPPQAVRKDIEEYVN